MDVKRRYYGAKEIQMILGVGRNTAVNILHMFDEQGKMFRYGRVMKVKICDFEVWLRENGEGRFPRS